MIRPGLQHVDAAVRHELLTLGHRRSPDAGEVVSRDPMEALPATAPGHRASAVAAWPPAAVPLAACATAS